MQIFGSPQIRVSVRVVSHLVVYAALLAACFASALCATAANPSAFHPTGSPTGGAAVLTPQLASPSPPDFGPNVYIFTPSMAQSEIQAPVDSIASQ